MEPQLARHPAPLPATPDTGKQGLNYFCTLQQSQKIFITFVDVLKGKWSCQHLCWACQLIPLTLNTGFGPGPLFFSLNQELSEQEAESCKFILMKTEARCSDTTFAERESPLSIRAEPSPDDATGPPWTEHTLRRWKITPVMAGSLCGFWKSSSSPEWQFACSPPTSLTFDWLLGAIFCLWTIKLF